MRRFTIRSSIEQELSALMVTFSFTLPACGYSNEYSVWLESGAASDAAALLEFLEGRAPAYRACAQGRATFERRGQLVRFSMRSEKTGEEGGSCAATSLELHEAACAAAFADVARRLRRLGVGR